MPLLAIPIIYQKKENFSEKRLAFTPKMRKLSLTRQEANKKQKTKGGKHYEDRKNHS
jgi:hypothetical protein